MNYHPAPSREFYAQSAVQSAQSGPLPNAVRPTTDLEHVRDRLHGAERAAAEINSKLAEIIIKLRGALGSQKGETAPVPQPCGLVSEMHQLLAEIGEHQSAAFEMLEQLAAVI